MKENAYDNDSFFEKYSRMTRSEKGLEGAGEWPALKRLLPDFKGKRVLDMGCGYGWHCAYAAGQGAEYVLGIDLSEKMLACARTINAAPQIVYRRCAIEDLSFTAESFDAVISSLVLHYVESFPDVARKTAAWLTRGGDFVFSVEHPIFTAEGPQKWQLNARGEHMYWPVDRYFEEGVRQAVFLGEYVTKYHKTLATYLNGLLDAGFEIVRVCEPVPGEELLAADPDARDELRRPQMLLIAARKK